MKKSSLIYLLLVISLFTYSCSEQKSKDPVTTPPSVQMIVPTIDEQLIVLSDSVNSAWHQLIVLDSQKFANIKRLIEEISYCKKYDEKAVTKGLKFNAEVNSMMYTQENLSDSIIDLYDKKTDDLIRFVRNLKSNTDEITQHPLADQLENEIMEADALLVNYRNKYDQRASEYNSFLEQNKETIASSNTKIAVKKPLFSVVL